MRLRTLIVLAGVLAGASPTIAQAPATAADPITGIWKGDIGLTDAQRTPVTFELKFDGATALSGKVTGPGPARFKDGTFTPATGAIVLHVEVQDGGATGLFLFEGIAVNGAAIGRVTGNNQQGTFKIAREGAAAPAAGSTGGIDPTDAVKAGFTELAGWISKAADLVPADKYMYQPVKTVRTFGQLVAHIVDGQAYYCGRASGQPVQWSDATANGKTDKATVVARLKDSMAACAAVYASGSGLPMLIANLGHSSLHYGNVITYMRMLGLTPPSSS
jgi:hypothetical protein